MVKYLNALRIAHIRLLLPVLAVFLLFLTSGCGLFGAKKKISVPQLLTPAEEAGRDRLIQEVNRLSTVTSIHGKVDIQFEDTSFATFGIADQYRLVDGDITIQRPGKIYLIIQFLLVDIAQMTSDGEQFRVAVLKGDDTYKRFVKGTNNAIYKKLDPDPAPTPAAKNQKKSEKETVNALSNLRPQHLTDAFMIRPIDLSGSVVYAQSEFFLEEPDTRPRAQKNARVMRPYYVLDEFSHAGGQAKLLRRLWFDRVSGIRLARVQSFDDTGALVTDVAYYNERALGSGPTASLPSRIEITRPQDQYKLSITYQDPGSVEVNRPGGYLPRAFVLENKWGLPEVDLDATNKKATANK